jgi:hypothetical protein
MISSILALQALTLLPTNLHLHLNVTPVLKDIIVPLAVISPFYARMVTFASKEQQTTSTLHVQEDHTPSQEGYSHQVNALRALKDSFANSTKSLLQKNAQ